MSNPLSPVKRSLQAVKEARAAEISADLQRKTKFFNTDTTVDNIFLRIIIHNNEHIGQLVAYVRMTGVVPPWSRRFETWNIPGRRPWTSTMPAKADDLWVLTRFIRM
jgi:uncharacterized damage-inducible protein DinB